MIARSPARYLHRRLRRMLLAAVLLISEAFLLALAGFWWWPLSLVALVPILFLGRATLLGGALDPVSLRSGIAGEERVAEILSALEPEGYRVLHDLDIERGNVDHVVVGPTGVFVIETKDWSGRFYPRRGALMFNQRSADEVVRQVTWVALTVRQRLESAGIDVWVRAVIVSTRAKVATRRIRLGHVHVVHADDLLDLVRGERTTLGDELASSAAAAIAGGRA